MEEQVGREAEYAGEGLWGGNASEDGDGTALGETPEDDAGGGYALVYLFFYEGVEVVAGFEDAGLVMGLSEGVEGCLLEKGLVMCGRWRVGRTISRGRTMSYQPGICMPKFWGLL